MENKAKPIRTFFAFEIDAATRQAAGEIIEHLRKQKHGDKVKWSKPEKLHVTLRFLGDVEPEKIQEIIHNVFAEIAAINSFVVCTGKVMAFPPQHSHVIAINIPLSKELAELVSSIERGVARSGFMPENRPYLAHITLGRIHSSQPLQFDAIPIKLPQQQVVKEVVFFRSDPSEEGSIYTSLARLSLHLK